MYLPYESDFDAIDVLPLKWCFRNLVCVYCDEPITKAGYISNTHNEYDYKCFKIAKKFFDDNDEIVLKFLGEKKYFWLRCASRLLSNRKLHVYK